MGHTPGKPYKSASSLVEAHLEGDFVGARRIWEAMTAEYGHSEANLLVEAVAIADSDNHPAGLALFSDIRLRLGHARRNS